MTTVAMQEAQIYLAQLVEKALQGEDIVLTQNGQALVKLVPVPTISPPGQPKMRPLGLNAVGLSDEEAQVSIEPLTDEELGYATTLC